jgi:hypothetical protein
MGVREASPLFFIKRGFLCIVFLEVSLPHLAGRGGEEVGKSGLSMDCSRESPHLEIRLSTVLSPRR